MDEIIFHIPYEKMITLRYLFKKEEEHFFEIITRHFFERINDLPKDLSNLSYSKRLAFLN